MIKDLLILHSRRVSGSAGRLKKDHFVPSYGRADGCDSTFVPNSHYKPGGKGKRVLSRILYVNR